MTSSPRASATCSPACSAASPSAVRSGRPPSASRPGARSRWAAIFAGLWMAVILIALSGLVGQVVMATLAAVLIAAAIGSLRTDAFLAILRTGRISQVAAPLDVRRHPAAAGGRRQSGSALVISLMMQLNQEAARPAHRRARPRGGGFSERPAPLRWSPAGWSCSTSTAACSTPVRARSSPGFPTRPASRRPWWCCGCAGAPSSGATSFTVLADYAERLHAAGGRFYLSGVDQPSSTSSSATPPSTPPHLVEIFVATTGSARRAWRRTTRPGLARRTALTVLPVARRPAVPQPPFGTAYTWQAHRRPGRPATSGASATVRTDVHVAGSPPPGAHRPAVAQPPF